MALSLSVGNALRGVPVKAGTPRRAFPTDLRMNRVQVLRHAPGLVRAPEGGARAECRPGPPAGRDVVSGAAVHRSMPARALWRGLVYRADQDTA